MDPGLRRRRSPDRSSWTDSAAREATDTKARCADTGNVRSVSSYRVDARGDAVRVETQAGGRAHTDVRVTSPTRRNDGLSSRAPCVTSASCSAGALCQTRSCPKLAVRITLRVSLARPSRRTKDISNLHLMKARVLQFEA